MKKAGNFDVMKRMSELDRDIRMSDQILRIQSTKRGTQVTIGIGGDLVAAIADGKLFGGLYLMDKAQFFQTQRELDAELAQAARGQEEAK